jgi:hypothetical protein
MSLPTTNPLPPDAPEPVFVDQSGRRHARTRIVARTIVAGAGIYVLVVIAGLTGSVSLPGAHLGVLRHPASGRANASRLGPGSKAVPLPSALRNKPKSTRAVATSPGDSGSAPGATSPLPGGTIGTDPAQPSPGNGTTTTAGPASPTTTPPSVTTTTKAHGPPTSTTHGPPSTKPGLGKGRNKL